MDRSGYYVMIHKLVEEGYGWEAIEDLTKMMCKEWNEAKLEARGVRWQNNTVRKFVKSDMTNTHKLDAIIDVLGEDGEA